MNWLVRTEIRDTESDWFVVSEIQMTQWVKPQDKWSEITYYRRYNLLSLLDLEVEDDDWKKAQDSKTEELAWYNDFDKHRDTYIDMIADGKMTAEKIIENLEWKYKLSTKTRENILNLNK
jgi:hypothetical protein